MPDAANDRPSTVNFGWPTIVSALTLAAVIASAGWILLQSQLTAGQFRSEAVVSGMRDEERVRNEGLANILREHIARIERLEARGPVFISRAEFEQFSRRFDSVIEQLRVLENTRPTTGELQAVNRNIADRLNALTIQINEQGRFLRNVPTRQPTPPSQAPASPE